MNQLPAGFAGLAIAALFAATMSSVDSGIHSIATTLTSDVYDKLSPDCPDEKRLGVARYITVLAGLCGTLAAVFLTFSGFDGEFLWILLLQVVIPIGSTLTGVFLLGASMAVVTLFTNMENSLLPHSVLKVAAGVLTCMVAGYLVSLLISDYQAGSKRQLTNLTLHTMVKKKGNGKQEAAHE